MARTEKVLHHTSCHSAEDLEPQNFGDRRMVLVRWVIGLVEPKRCELIGVDATPL